MVFNSISFLIFLAVTLTIYYNLSFKPQNIFLLFASYFFYGWWNWRFLFLLLFTSGFDYLCALAIQNQPVRWKKKWLLAFSIIVNMGVLCTFKYFNFFITSVSTLLRAIGMQPNLPTLHVILPIGISFYTFLSMSYTIDVYRGRMKASRDPIAFLLFVCFFPHLVAGPIVRASYLLPQCERPRVIESEQVSTGIWLILLGYVKKVVIADRLAAVVDFGFANHGLTPFQNANAWVFLYAFAFQIYGDFAGYSDIARGLAKIMGFELPINFRAPYLVTNPAEFWHHWHITLSTWLRDYLYIPLGGNRKGPIRTYVNLLITMLLGGLWHGAGLAYVLWGAYQGALLVIHRAWRYVSEPARQLQTQLRSGFRPRELPSALLGQSRAAIEAQDVPAAHGILRPVFIVLFFHVICIGWLLFRAGSVPAGFQYASILSYLSAMVRPVSLAHLSEFFRPVIILGGLALFFQYTCEKMDLFNSWPRRLQITAVVCAVLLIAGLGVFSGAQFIYFQF